ncbi:DUF6415 family natural product biosynthesis protein [Streptomyces sp. WAC06128]|uniref:DUF6415 family natural product biosynthesis protein n=1 Tax=Streptomyces sp. WAC06128 TaxID=2487426 RepID=UPI001C8EB77E|nr:DUF6415 family natural product biosynthesis protein [Streptomyces sp. WAC06128]
MDVIEAGLPLDREPYECLVKAVLAWTDEDALTARDLEQIALQLTGHARAVASDVRRRADRLPKDSGPKALADVVLREAQGRLSVPIEGTGRCVQNRARLHLDAAGCRQSSTAMICQLGCARAGPGVSRCSTHRES